MTGQTAGVIDGIRTASRELVRELGFMNRTLAGTNLPPSAVHAVIEIGIGGGRSAKALADALVLEKSTVSRLVQSLVKKGLVREIPSSEDSRMKHLHLTEQGKAALDEITRFATRQVETAIAPLRTPVRQNILDGLNAYSAALKASRRQSSPPPPRATPRIVQGYTTGLIGRAAEMHANYYSRLVGFGCAFETKVAGELSEFISRLDHPGNAIWHVLARGRVAGSIAIDGEDLRDGAAHLRWFIIDDGLRGAGIGNRLIRDALDFCDRRGFAEVHLWTFSGLDAARRLYEKHGFALVDECRGDQWGTEVLEQKFVRS